MAHCAMPCPRCLAPFTFSEDASVPQQCPACREAEAAHWFYIVKRQKIGPVAGNELRRLCQAGKLARTDMVLRHGETRWTAASDVPGLFSPVVSTATLAVSGGSEPVAHNAIQEVCPAAQMPTLTAVAANSSGTDEFISVGAAPDATGAYFPAPPVPPAAHES
jgi:hypothetical protein